MKILLDSIKNKYTQSFPSQPILLHPRKFSTSLLDLKVKNIPFDSENFIQRNLASSRGSYLSFKTLLDSFRPNHGIMKKSKEYNNLFSTTCQHLRQKEIIFRIQPKIIIMLRAIKKLNLGTIKLLLVALWQVLINMKVKISELQQLNDLKRSLSTQILYSKTNIKEYLRLF
ncbi:hypothetical protein RF11_01390 [Thelohanellus kitauei]|uniref:Uncharacterized protein n=1 Tax=Thelohanellus kitauei TaxID=669202 RepID=A0A0C2N6B4_THEKT|nr:hypothetical protein RF11_01390 [Thelohanellus kitauei]